MKSDDPMQNIKITVVILLMVAISFGGSIKERKKKIRETQETRPVQEFSDDESSMWIPGFPGYHLRYGPAIVPLGLYIFNIDKNRNIKRSVNCR